MLAWLVAFLAAPAVAHAVSFAKGPYLHDVQSDVAEIRVELDANGAAALELTRAGQAPRTLPHDDARAFHVFRVDKLEPATRYDYAVKIAGGAVAKGSFSTAPKGDATAPFKFLVYGDNRNDPINHQTVVQAMVAAPSDFVVNTGDFVYAGSDAAEWQTFFSIEAGLLRDRCLFAAIGNHELYQDDAATAFMRYFGDASGKLYSTFRWQNARFFLLNAFPEWDNGQERAWLERELTAADSEPNLKWRFVVVHQGPYSAGRHGPSQSLVEARVPELFVAHNVDLVLSGHDHTYERGWAGANGKGLRYLVSGGGGAPLYRQQRRTDSTRKFEATYHFIEIDVAEEAVKIRAQRSDGTLIERCGFGHSVGWDCDGRKDVTEVTTVVPPSPTEVPPHPPAARTLPAGATSAAPAPAAPRTDSKCGCRVPGEATDAPRGAAVAILAAAAASLRRRSRVRSKSGSLRKSS